MINNLISNAVNYSSARSTVAISYKSTDDKTIVAIKDTESELNKLISINYLIVIIGLIKKILR